MKTSYKFLGAVDIALLVVLSVLLVVAVVKTGRQKREISNRTDFETDMNKLWEK